MERNSEETYNYNKVSIQREVMTLRAHNYDDGYFLNLFKLRAIDDTNILRALNTNHAHTYISSNIQND